MNSSVTIHLSNGVLTTQKGEEVRILSYAVSFEGPDNGSLAKIHCLNEMASGSGEMAQTSLGGITPEASIAPHHYQVNVSLKPGIVWGEASDNDVIVDVVRLK